MIFWKVSVPSRIEQSITLPSDTIFPRLDGAKHRSQHILPSLRMTRHFKCSCAAREADHTWKINAYNQDDSNKADSRGRAESQPISSLINSDTPYTLSTREDSQRTLDASTKAGGKGNFGTRPQKSGPQYNCKILYASLNDTIADKPWERAWAQDLAEFGQRNCYAGRLPADYTLSSTPNPANTHRDTAELFNSQTSSGHANDADDKDHANSKSTAIVSLMRGQYNPQPIISGAETREIAINAVQKDEEREDKFKDEMWPTTRKAEELGDGMNEATNHHQDESKQRDDDKPGQQAVEGAQAFDTVSQEAESGSIRSDSAFGDSFDPSTLSLSTQDSTVNTHKQEGAQGAGCAVPESVLAMEPLAGIWSTDMNREQDMSTSTSGTRIRFVTQPWSSSRDVGSRSFAPTNPMV